LSEIDKSTPTAIEYWFRCMDVDGDGIITSYELAEYWEDNNRRLQYMNEMYGEDDIRFDDLMRQL
ncbi:hypothetical protein K501DRAFT_177204, partial [Backusella circina FSU 941]